MVALINTQEHDQIAKRIRHDLEVCGFTITNDTLLKEEAELVIVLLSEDAVKEYGFIRTIETILDAYGRIIPVKLDRVDLPSIIDHLPFVDFASGYNINELQECIRALDARPPLTVLTPSKRQSNQHTATILSLVVIFIFIVAILGIMAGITLPPEDEFASVETQIVLTRSYFVDLAMPASTGQAAEFELTVEQVATAVRVQLIGTATAVAGGVEGTFVPRSTEQAEAFEATLKVISTVVHDRLAATVTQNAITAGTMTPTP